jgi:hypothetical protein
MPKARKWLAERGIKLGLLTSPVRARPTSILLPGLYYSVYHCFFIRIRIRKRPCTLFRILMLFRIPPVIGQIRLVSRGKECLAGLIVCNVGTINNNSFTERMHLRVIER